MAGGKEVEGSRVHQMKHTQRHKPSVSFLLEFLSTTVDVDSRLLFYFVSCSSAASPGERYIGCGLYLETWESRVWWAIYCTNQPRAVTNRPMEETLKTTTFESVLDDIDDGTHRDLVLMLVGELETSSVERLLFSVMIIQKFETNDWTRNTQMLKAAGTFDHKPFCN